MQKVIEDEQVTVVPANEASWEDLQAIFGTADAGHCQCQRFKIKGWIWRDSTQDERTAMLQDQTSCGTPDAPSTSGVVAYVDGEPAGWVAVEPRTAYPMLTQPAEPSPGENSTSAPTKPSKKPASARSPIPPSVAPSCGSTSTDQGTTTTFPIAWLFSMYSCAATMSSRLKTRSTFGR